MSTLTQRYRILRPISVHDNSTVWLAEHIGLGVRRIIKGIPKTSPYYGVLTSEAHLIRNLNHPNIPAVYDTEEDEAYFYLIEQYIEGPSLGERCRTGLLSQEEFFHYFICIASVIDYLHSPDHRIYYLDLKPDNIILSSGEAYLIDFGGAVPASETAQGPLFGSRSFAAPEQLRGDRPDDSTDIYGLGGLLAYMAEHSDLSPRVRCGVDRLAAGCRAENRTGRISSAAVVISMLGKIKKRDLRAREKQKGKTAPAGCVRIGVHGLSRGCGVTHISIALASYMSDIRGRKVCLFEKNDHRHISELAGLQAEDRDGCWGSFTLGRVTYLPSDWSPPGTAALGKAFDCIIYDLGSGKESLEAVREYCDIIMEVESFAPWRKLIIPTDTGGGAAFNGEGSYLLLNPADNKSLRRYKGSRIPMLAMPYERDPFHPGRETVRVFEKVTEKFCR